MTQVLFGIISQIARTLGANVSGAPCNLGALALPTGQRLAKAAPYNFPKPDAAFVQGLARWTGGGGLTPPAAQHMAPGPPGALAGAKVAPAGAATPAAPVQASGNHADDAGCPSCVRWLLFCIAAPLLVIVSVAGMLLWVLFLPIRLLCPLCGCPMYALVSAVEALIKMPLRAMLWASSKEQGPKGAVKASH